MDSRRSHAGPTATRRAVLVAANAVPGVPADAMARILGGAEVGGAEVGGAEVGGAEVGISELLRCARLPAEPAAEVARRLDAHFPAREAERVAALGGWIIVRGDPEYPPSLETIADPPAVLYGLGTIPSPDRAAIAIVGARRASRYGITQAERFAYLLGALGAVVVSGMARGIDGAAHTGCLDAGGATIAVLGAGLDVPYPREHAALARRIAEHGGAVLSELPLGAPPLAWHFPRRNRIIAGLSAGVIVVEAEARSGSLVTARLALDAGREVLAIPGPIDAPGSAGPHQLIRDGAILVGGIDDVVSALPALAAQIARTGRGGATGGRVPPADGLAGPPTPDSRTDTDGGGPERALVLAVLSEDPLPLDRVAYASRLPLPRVMAILCLMSMAGMVIEHPGQRYSRPRWAA